MEEEKTVVELTNAYAIVEIPEDIVELTLECKVYLDGKLQTVRRTMSMKECRDAMEEYKAAEECGYIPPDAVFTLTEAGEDWLNWRDEQEAMERAGY